MAQTRTILTDYGNAQVLQAIAQGTEIIVHAMVYGDGGGSSYEPVMSQTSLINQIGSITGVTKEYDSVDDFIYFNATIPANAPECTIRELGLVDTTDQLLAIAVIPDTEKPALEEGLEVTLPISIGFKTSTGEVMIVEVGPGTDVPDKDWVNQKIAEAMDDRANLSLSNLNATGNSKLLPSQINNDYKVLTTVNGIPMWGSPNDALKGYLDDGQVLRDDRLINSVRYYASSTFDISKFTVVGDPTITADGIASNLSTSNYLTAIPSSMYYNKSNWHLQFKGNFDPTIACGFMDFDNDVYAYLAYMDGWHSITLQLYDVNNQQIFISIEQADNKFVKGDILLDIYYSSTSGYYFTATQNGVTYTSEASSNTNQLKNASTQPLLYIHSTSTISIDLKTIKFFVDNQPVFNGNIDGIDTVYTNNYTIVGNPTIVNSVVSGFDNNNYLTKNLKLSGSSLKLRTRFKTGILGTTTQVLFDSTYFMARLLYISSSSLFFLSAFFGDGTYSTQPRNTSNAIQANTEYLAEFELIQGESARVTLYKADGTVIESSQTSSGQTKDVVIPNSEVLATIGHKSNNNFSGSIYLDDFAIYSNNKCIYRPNLLIPYIQSSTGSLVVDAFYKDRVIDVYNQFGSADYYIFQSITLLNYTVAGTPTITNDYIASGFSNSKYILNKQLIDFTKPFSIKVNEKRDTATTFSGFGVGQYTNVGYPLVFIQPTGSSYITIGLYLNGSLSTYDYQFIHANYTDINYILYWTGIQYGLIITNAIDGTTIINQTIDSAVALKRNNITLGYLTIGYNFNSGKAVESTDLKLSTFTQDNITTELISYPNASLPMGEIYGFSGIKIKYW